AFDSPAREAMTQMFAAPSGSSSGEEPMMNIIVSRNVGRWRAIIFPRIKHRPTFYFAQGDKKILLSPAAVEMGGVCTLPIEREFDRLTREHVEQMYHEVCAPADQIDQLCQRLTRIV